MQHQIGRHLRVDERPFHRCCSRSSSAAASRRSPRSSVPRLSTTLKPWLHCSERSVTEQTWLARQSPRGRLRGSIAASRTYQWSMARSALHGVEAVAPLQLARRYLCRRHRALSTAFRSWPHCGAAGNRRDNWLPVGSLHGLLPWPHCSNFDLLANDTALPGSPRLSGRGPTAGQEELQSSSCRVTLHGLADVAPSLRVLPGSPPPAVRSEENRGCRASRDGRQIAARAIASSRTLRPITQNIGHTLESTSMASRTRRGFGDIRSTDIHAA